ncbi:hypothetical protein P7C73_g200, partial [Tremellales sp. Uapishka_1]
MGHESAGEVVAVGEMVTTHQVGDRVAVEPGLPCRRCVNCKSGRVNICLSRLVSSEEEWGRKAHNEKSREHMRSRKAWIANDRAGMRYCGSPGSVGSLMRYFALPADMAPHIPDNISWEVAGSIQPLAIGVQVGKRVDLRPHLTLAICGCGPIGLITAAVAHAYSARKIIGFDINPSRVEFARKYMSPLTGKPIYDYVFLSESIPTTPLSGNPLARAEKQGEAPGPAGIADGEVPDAEEDPTEGDIRWENAKLIAAEWVAQAGLTAEEGFDRVVEASGAEDCGLLGVALAKQGGNYLAIGLGHIQTHLMPTLAITNKELDVRGITRYTASCFPSAIDMLSRGVVDLKPLITKVYPLTQSTEAFEAVASGREIKVIVKNQE